MRAEASSSNPITPVDSNGENVEDLLTPGAFESEGEEENDDSGGERNSD